MNKYRNRICSLILAISVFVTCTLTVVAADWLSVKDDLRAPLEAKKMKVEVTDVDRKVSNLCYDLQSEYPTSLYKLKADGRSHDAICVAARRSTPGDGGTVYRLDISGLKSHKGSSSRLQEASANLVASDENYTVWWYAYRYSDLYKYNDEQIMRKIAWLVDDGKWTYYPLAKKYGADDTHDGIKLDFDKPLNSSNIYRDLQISTDAQDRYKPFDIPESRVGDKISGLYGAAHAIASRIISGDRYNLSGTIYYSFTLTESDKSTYLKNGHATYAYGDDGNGNENNMFRRIQLIQYFNIIAHAPEYDGELYLYSPDKRSGSGQQWLLFVDRSYDYIDKVCYVKPAVDKNAADGSQMNGAEFTVYKNADCTSVMGVLTDNDGNGYYSNYANKLSGSDEKDNLILLKNNDDGTFTKTIYLKETKAPAEVIYDSGNKVTLTEELIDEDVYKVTFKYDYAAKTMKVTAKSGDDTVYTKTYKDYDAVNSPSNVYIGSSEDGDIKDGSGLSVIKQTDTGFNVKDTVFELYMGDDLSAEPVAYFKYGKSWSWYSDAEGKVPLGTYFPVAPDSTYTLVEKYKDNFYKDTAIRNETVNSSGWDKVSGNTYKHTFTTKGYENGDLVSVSVTNDLVTSGIKITKTSDDNIVEGVEFDIYYLGNDTDADAGEGIYLDTVKTDKNGVASLDDMPLGWYRIREKDREGYCLKWQEGTQTTGSDALVHLTKDVKTFELTANNRVSVRVAVIKKDSWTGEYLSGAEFRMYEDKDGDGKITGDERSSFIELKDDDGDGIALAEDIGIGRYVIEEHKAPFGYYASKEGVAVNVTGKTDNVVTVNGNELYAYVGEVSDEPYAAPVRIHKTDSRDDSKKLTGASFKICEDTNGSGEYEEGEDKAARVKKDGKYYDVFVTERDGYYEGVIDTGEIEVANLRFGTYFVVETVAPEMYVATGKAKTVVIDKKDTSGAVTPVEVTFVNELDFKTSLTGEGGSKIAEYGKEIKLTDTIRFTNLVAGRTYTAEGELMLKDEEGNVVSTGITGKTEFTVEDNGNSVAVSDGTVRTDGEVNVDFYIDVSSYKGKGIVAYESLFTGGRLVAEHKDPDDDDQTVSLASIKTELMDIRTGTHAASYGMTELADNVRYENLVPGKTYQLSGVLIDKETGEELSSGSKEFTAEDKVGMAQVIMELDTMSLYGHELVAFEELLYEGKVIALHKDIEDEDQSVKVGNLVTSASGSDGIKIIRPVKNASVIDRVEYENLIPGQKYRIRGQLYYAAGGKEFFDPSGKTVTQDVVFTPEDETGVIHVEFGFNATGLKEGDKVVVYEDCFVDTGAEDVLVCSHRDPSNTDQTVTVTDVPKTGDEGINGDHVTGLAAAIGMIVSVIGICVMINKKLFDLL